MLIKEIVYYLLDSIKSLSDDSIITEDHVIFLIKKYRSMLLKRELDKEKLKAELSLDFEYQQICIDLEKIETIPGMACEEGYMLRSKQEIPKVLSGTTPRVYPINYYSGIHVAFISMNRMRFVGTNPYLKNIIYVSIGPDKHLYLKSSNPQFLYLKKIRFAAIFEDFDAATNLLCDDSGNETPCDVLDAEFPFKDYLVPLLIEYVEKELLGVNYRPRDTENNAQDDLSTGSANPNKQAVLTQEDNNG